MLRTVWQCLCCPTGDTLSEGRGAALHHSLLSGRAACWSLTGQLWETARQMSGAMTWVPDIQLLRRMRWEIEAKRKTERNLLGQRIDTARCAHGVGRADGEHQKSVALTRPSTSPPSQHGLKRAKRGIDGDLWRRGTATMSYPCDACEEKLPCSVDVLPGRASAIQATRGDGIGRLGGASSKQLWQGSQHSRRACSSRNLPGSTGRQDNKDGAGCSSCFTFLSTCSKDCGANATFFKVRRVTEATPSQNGKGNPRRVSHYWQVTKEIPSPRKTL